MNRWLFGSFLFFALALMANSYNSIPIGDDFCNYFQANTIGPFNYATDIYLKWSGRYLTTLAMGLGGLVLPLEKQNLISVILSILFLVFIWGISKLIKGKFNEKEETFIVIAFLTTLSWFAYRQVIGRVVIWYTGGMVYILCYVLMPLFFLEFIRNLKDKSISPTLIILSILLANSLETIPPAVIFFMLGYLILNKEFFTKPGFKYFFVLSLIITVASIPLFAAPGNFTRASTNSSLSNFTLYGLMISYVDVFKVYFDSAKNIALLSIPIGLISSLFLSPSTRHHRVRIGLCLLIAAIGSALPMGFASGFNGSRPASLFVFLASFGLFSIFSAAKHSFNLSTYKNQVASSLLVITGIFVSFDFYRGLNLRKQFESRDLYLKSLSNTDAEVEIESFQGKMPRSLNSHELKHDPSHWSNVCVANHYKIKSVRIKKNKRIQIH